MKLHFHLPRRSEATITPDLEDDFVVRPHFYKRVGMIPVFYFTTEDSGGEKEQYVLLMNAGNKAVRCEKLVEVIPDCDNAEKKRKKKVKEEMTDATK